jgi:hypothetical protein
VLAWAGVAPPIVLVGWLLASYPLLRAGVAGPAVAVPLALVIIALLLRTLRGLPRIPGTPAWAVWSTLAVVVGFVTLAAATHAEHVVVRRDAGVYALTARWLADHGSLTIPADLAAVGGSAVDGSVGVASPGFFAVGDGLSAQFMSGSGLGLVPGAWVAGWAGIFMLPAVYAGLGLLAVAALAARLVGPRWAPIAALALALTQPVLLSARTTYSEPMAQLLVFGAVCLLVDSLTAQSGQRRIALVAGLALGISLLIRIDALRELVLLVPVVGWLAIRRRPQWLPLAAGAGLAATYGLLDALGPSRPYVSSLSEVVRPLLLGGAVVLVGTALAVLAARRLGPRMVAVVGPTRLRTWLAWAVGGTVAIAAGYLAIRPLFGPVYHTNVAAGRVVAGLQESQGLPVDGMRSYWEQSVRWVAWYTGWIGLLLAALAAVALLWWAVRRDRERWLVALAVPAASTALVLQHPGITPDHPFADRRLVPTVLPLVALLATCSLAAGVRLLSAHRPRLILPAVALGLLALLVPAAWATAPLAGARTEHGELDALRTACAAFGPDSAALLVDARSRQEWTPGLRQVCGVPTFVVPADATDRDATRAEVEAVAARVRAAGRQPILVAQSGKPLPTLTAAPQRRVVQLQTAEHDRKLTRRPSRVAALQIELWVAPAG